MKCPNCGLIDLWVKSTSEEAQGAKLYCCACRASWFKGKMICNKPPKGWWCSREPGHTGPCAARPRWWMRFLIWFFVRRE